MSKEAAEASSRKGPAKRDARAETAPTERRDRKRKQGRRTSDHELRRQLTSLREFS